VPPADWAELFRQPSRADAMRWIQDHLDPSAERDAVGAWDAARTELERSERGLRSRTLEIGLIQSLGQRAAEATGFQDLFARAADVLESMGDLAATLVLHRLRGGHVEAQAFLGAPADTELLETLARRAERFLDWAEAPDLAVVTRRTGGHDARRAALRTIREQDCSFLPLQRRGRTIACLVLVHDAPPDEARQRVLFSAANQVSLHLDRILAVRESEEHRFRAILDSMSAAVVRTAADGSIVHANRAAIALLERLGLPTEGGRMPDGSPFDLTPFLARIDARDGGPVEEERRLSSGQVVHISVAPFDSPDERERGLVAVLTDVSEARRMQDQLAQAEKMSSLGQMISGVAHELNNPLASILGYAQLLRSTSQDDGLRAKLEVLDRESRRCQKIVRNLLSFARRHEPERKPVSLNEIVGTVLPLLRYQLKVDGVTVETDLDPSLPAIAADGHLLQQVLINLLTNAHHAMRDAGTGGTVRVATACAPQDGAIVLTVEDDGPGVPEEIRTRVFDPFFTTKEPGRGTGLGLSLVYANVHAHDGDVRLEDASGGGARFVITLPPAALAEGRLPEAESPAPPARVRPSGRVLVVEDETAIADLVREALECDGHEVALAPDGLEALRRLGGERFDALLLDWRTPGLGGERLFEEIRRRHPDLAGRVVLTTGDTVSREPDRLAEREGLPIVHKPFDLDDLRDAVVSRLAGVPDS
jgi:two-component system NtrC family sensor kinase